MDRDAKTVIPEEKRKIYLTVWDIWKGVIFSMLQKYNHVCIVAPVHGLLEYARIFGFEPILGWLHCMEISR